MQPPGRVVGACPPHRPSARPKDWPSASPVGPAKGLALRIARRPGQSTGPPHRPSARPKPRPFASAETPALGGGPSVGPRQRPPALPNHTLRIGVPSNRPRLCRSSSSGGSKPAKPERQVERTRSQVVRAPMRSMSVREHRARRVRNADHRQEPRRRSLLESERRSGQRTNANQRSMVYLPKMSSKAPASPAVDARNELRLHAGSRPNRQRRGDAGR